MDYSLVRKAFNEVKPQLDEADSFFEGGLCVLAARLAYEHLTDLGVKDLRVVGGKALFSLNKGRHGLIDFGYSTNSLVGRQVGHYWVEHKEKGVIDFSLAYLKKMFVKDNERRGVTDNTFELDGRILLPFYRLSSYDELLSGAIGYHYLEIPNRGETLWLNRIPELDC